MPRNPPDPETVRLALDGVRSGMSHAEVGRELGLAATTIGRWVADAKDPTVVSRSKAPQVVLDRARARKAASPPAEPEEAPADEEDLVSTLKRLQREMLMNVQASKNVGNMTAAQRGLKAVADLAPLLARLEKAGREDHDVLRISREEIAAARASYDAKVRALLDRPLLCSRCSRELSVEWGHGSDPDPTSGAR